MFHNRCWGFANSLVARPQVEAKWKVMLPKFNVGPQKLYSKNLQLIGPCMISRHSLMATILFLPFVCGAQEQAVIPLKSEPHHHLALHNHYVNVYSIYVPPHDSVLLPKHHVT